MEWKKPVAPAADGPADADDDSATPRNGAASSRRVGVRVALRGAARLRLPGDQLREVTTCDVSREGLSLLTARPVAPGTRCSVEFELPLRDSQVAVTVAAKSMYSSYTGAEGFRVGLQFASLSDDAAGALDAFMQAERP